MHHNYGLLMHVEQCSQPRLRSALMRESVGRREGRFSSARKSGHPATTLRKRCMQSLTPWWQAPRNHSDNGSNRHSSIWEATVAHPGMGVCPDSAHRTAGSPGSTSHSVEGLQHTNTTDHYTNEKSMRHRSAATLNVKQRSAQLARAANQAAHMAR